MKKVITTTVAALLLIISFNSDAQKLPSVQKASIRPPANLKIDGKSTDWTNKFQAYNSSTNIFYSLANDDEYLYLIVQSTNIGINSKILIGGLTFSINPSGEKKDKDAISIMFPAVNDNSKRAAIRGAMASLNNPKNEAKSPEARKKQMDSISYVLNRQQIDKLKEIKVKGIKEIQDTLISIYNDQDITARALFENQNTYTYELALPLKYLNLSIDHPKEFAYSITLNGVLSGFGDRASQIAMMGSEGGRPMMTGPGGVDIRVLAFPTDLRGKYILAKK